MEAPTEHALLSMTRGHSLVELPVVNEGSVLHVLRDRFERDEIYTKVGGDILISINPFKVVSGMYGEDVMLRYVLGGLEGSLQKNERANERATEKAFREVRGPVGGSPLITRFAAPPPTPPPLPHPYPTPIPQVPPKPQPGDRGHARAARVRRRGEGLLWGGTRGDRSKVRREETRKKRHEQVTSEKEKKKKKDQHPVVFVPKRRRGFHHSPPCLMNV